MLLFLKGIDIREWPDAIAMAILAALKKLKNLMSCNQEISRDSMLDNTVKWMFDKFMSLTRFKEKEKHWGKKYRTNILQISHSDLLMLIHFYRYPNDTVMQRCSIQAKRKRKT